jgi:LmbE family N-acetylglucosaminyl deacetylase
MMFSDTNINVLVVAAHPDDEVLGCGGTIARHGARDDRVDILFLTDGVSARGSADPDAVERRRRSAVAAAEILGAQPPRFGTFPDNRLDGVELLDVVQHVEAVLAERPYDLVYTHWKRDLNFYHLVATGAGRPATRPLPGQSVRTVLAFEVASSSEWAFAAAPASAPNVAVSIDSHIEQKLEALAAYTEEVREPPHPRALESVRALAAWRGAQHGFAFAEAFSLVRASHG